MASLFNILFTASFVIFSLSLILQTVQNTQPIDSIDQYETISNTFGVNLIQGRRKYMEDTFSTYFPPLDIISEIKLSNKQKASLFAVFDGHGADKISIELSKRFLKILYEDCFIRNEIGEGKSKNDLQNCVTDSFVRFDDLLKNEFLNIRAGGSTAIISAIYFSQINNNDDQEVNDNKDEKKDKYSIELVGMNLGDSRAVFSKSNSIDKVIPLSFDHKPDGESELKRIKEGGGFVANYGVPRVNGVLATSRSFGDFDLKPHVFNEPEFVHLNIGSLILSHQKNNESVELFDSLMRPITQVDGEIESLIGDNDMIMVIASDGFWDVFTNEEAIQYIRNKGKGSITDINELSKNCVDEAYRRRSSDNITVLIVNISKFLLESIGK